MNRTRVKQSQPSRDSFHLTAAMAAGFAALFGLWLRFEFFGAGFTHWFNDVAGTIVALGAGLMCFVAASRVAGRARRAWLLTGAGVAAWGLGETAWTYYELILERDVPFPSFADVGYLAFIPLVVAGMIMFPSGRRNSASCLRTGLDGMIIVASLLFVSWATVLGPLFRDSGGGVYAKIIGLAYPVGDIAVASIALLLLRRSRPGNRSALGLLAIGLIALAFCDSLFAYLTLHDRYQTGGFLDVGWVVAFLLMGLGALRSFGRPPSDEDEEHTSWVQALLPYAVVSPVVAIVIQRVTREGATLGPFLTWCGVALFALVLVRQFLSLRVNLSIARHFESEVVARTADLRRSEERTRSILQTANDAFIAIDSNGVIAEWNRRAEDMFGWPREQAIGSVLPSTMLGPEPESHRRLTSAITTAGQRRGAGNRIELSARHRERGALAVEATVWRAGDTALPTVNMFVRDISDRKRFEDQLRHQALHDAITGLANRTLFEDRIGRALASAARTGAKVAVLFLDCDDFKTINDSLGHAAGDQVLIAVAKRLADVVRPYDSVARFGGDEFCVMLEDLRDPAQALTLADRVIEAFNDPWLVGEREIYMSASIGVAVGNPNADGHELIRDADLAMYAAKAKGGASVQIFEQAMHSALVERLDVETDLKRAVAAGDQFVLLYQPVVDLQTGSVQGVEALVRWVHPTRGVVSPTEFIPVAEATGLIVPIGELVLRQACRQAASWNADPRYAPCAMHVNVSVKQFKDAYLLEKIRAALVDSCLDPSLLTLEITESSLMDDGPDFVERLTAIRDLGVRIAIDDFGTGYSGLAYLQRLPVDVLKIDRTFVRGVTGDVEDSALARAIVKLGETFRVDVVAEGIESAGQAEVLAGLGCRYGQGFYFAPPLEVGDLEAMIDREALTGAPGDRAMRATA